MAQRQSSRVPKPQMDADITLVQSLADQQCGQSYSSQAGGNPVQAMHIVAAKAARKPDIEQRQLRKSYLAAQGLAGPAHRAQAAS